MSPRWPKIRFLRRSYQAPPTSFPAVVDSPPGTQSPFSAGLLVEKPLWPRTLSVLVKLPPHLSSQTAAPQRPLPTTKRKMTTFCHRRHHTHTPPSLSPRNGLPHWRLTSTRRGDSLQTKTTTAESTLSLLIRDLRHVKCGSTASVGDTFHATSSLGPTFPSHISLRRPFDPRQKPVPTEVTAAT